MGVVSAILRFYDVDLFAAEWNASKGAEWLSIVMYIAIIAYMIWDSRRIGKKADAE